MKYVIVNASNETNSYISTSQATLSIRRIQYAHLFYAMHSSTDMPIPPIVQGVYSVLELVDWFMKHIC